MRPLRVSVLFLLCIFLIIFCRQGLGCPKQEKVLINQHTTLRRHAAAVHSVCFTPHLTSILQSLLFSTATGSGVSRTISTPCYLRMPRSARGMLKRESSHWSLSTLTQKTRTRSQSHIAKRPSRLPPSSGLLKQTRCALLDMLDYSFIYPILILADIVADSNIRQRHVQENA